MIILILWVASASVGLAIGVVFLRALVIVVASPFVAFLSATVLLYRGFGLVNVGLISVGSLAALQSFYLLGLSMRYLTMHDERVRPEIALRARKSKPRRKSAGRSGQPEIS
jgi:hypothetical protein